MGTPGSDGQDTKKLAAARTSFPDYPGGNFLAHAGSQYKEDIDARLSMLGLLGVAQGGDSPAVCETAVVVGSGCARGVCCKRDVHVW